jgi:predicted nucleic acid-binding protein
VNLYLDTSALVKLFIDEEGHHLVRSGVGDATVVMTSVVAYAECRSAFARRHRAGDINQVELRTLVDRLSVMWPGMERYSVTEWIAHEAGALAETYALRGFDAIHLASAIRAGGNFGAITFLAFDDRLNAGAEQAGLELFVSGRQGAIE